MKKHHVPIVISYNHMVAEKYLGKILKPLFTNCNAQTSISLIITSHILLFFFSSHNFVRGGGHVIFTCVIHLYVYEWAIIIYAFDNIIFLYISSIFVLHHNKCNISIKKTEVYPIASLRQVFLYYMLNIVHLYSITNNDKIPILYCLRK